MEVTQGKKQNPVPKSTLQTKVAVYLFGEEAGNLAHILNWNDPKHFSTLNFNSILNFIRTSVPVYCMYKDQI